MYSSSGAPNERRPTVTDLLDEYTYLPVGRGRCTVRRTALSGSPNGGQVRNASFAGRVSRTSLLSRLVAALMAVSGDTAVVGAYSDDVGPNDNQGSAYVFVRSGATWSHLA